ncbi:HTH-type transcriptional regulator PrtR [compost metagenome]
MSEKPDYIAEEAARLKAAYRARKKVDPSLTQELIAHTFNWSGQSAVSQYMNGHIPLNLQALLGFASLLGVHPSSISPRLVPPNSELAVAIDEVKRGIDPSHRIGRDALEDAAPLEVWDDGTPLADDEVELPFFKEVELSAGKGSEVMLESSGRKVRFGKRTLQKKQIDSAAAACVSVSGDSMEPVLPNGCTVAINTNSRVVQDGSIYAIDHAGELRVKVLYRLPGGGLRIRSYNDAEYPDERYDAEYVEHNIRIIGKVFWYSVLL